MEDSVAAARERRPLVSLLLIAFNQQATIVEAIAGAYAKTAASLEIPISDDASGDGTWEALLAEVHKIADAAGEVEWVVAIDSTIARVHQHGATLTRGTGGRIESQESVVVGAA